MPRKPSKRPSTPEEIAARKLAERMADFAAVSLDPSYSVLKTAEDIVVHRKSQTTVEGARRSDVFDALKRGMDVGAYDAARRFERDYLTSLGLHDRGRPMMRVDEDSRTADRFDRMLTAQSVLLDLAFHLPPAVLSMLKELANPTIPGLSWRGVVQMFTMERNEPAQAAIVRQACAWVKWAYERIEARRAA